ncbi:MAG: imidazole glycerol phosphate synthase subunit HisH [Anaerolineae bacterium]|jgi:glutamine amidotransferase|nr:imidazole glycerol phosphate synthase subunit HisH [Chloroflexota bacterium]
MLAIVDYGLGNLRNVAMAFRRLGLAPQVSDDPSVLARAQALVLPGVGAFGDAMQGLAQLGLVSVLQDAVAAGRPMLGICLGMQLLFESSDELGSYRGLGILPGTVRRFAPPLIVPHMGWNQVSPTRSDPLFTGIEGLGYAYFVHSYHVVPADDDVVIARTTYGEPFPSIVRRGRLYGIQFHPEKSQDMGALLLKNWLALAGMGTESEAAR